MNFSCKTFFKYYTFLILNIFNPFSTSKSKYLSYLLTFVPRTIKESSDKLEQIKKNFFLKKIIADYKRTN